jgi:hypothetical protein
MRGAKRPFPTMHGLVEYLGPAAVKNTHSKKKNTQIGLEFVGVEHVHYRTGSLPQRNEASG